MKKFWFSLLLLSFSGSLFCQVKFNLNYQSETKTYTVSVVPEASYPEPKNTVSSAQIVLRAKFNENFTPIITSLVDGLIWTDNSYIDYPKDAPQYTYVCVALANGPTKKIHFVSGIEIPLFSIKNAGGECPGLIELISNDDAMVQEVRASGFNVTQHLGVLGARGNAYAGVQNGIVECLESSSTTTADAIIGEMQIAPVPADRRVTIRWHNLSELSPRMEMVITDSRTREVYREKVSSNKGENSVNIDVGNWLSGMYNIRFQLDHGGQTRGWHFMVLR